MGENAADQSDEHAPTMPTRRGRPARSDARSRRSQILDAAEVLLSKNGMEGVALRDIAKLAQVDTALASYHFGSKAGLFEAVLERRAEILNRLRLDALARFEAEAENGIASVGQVIEAYLRPMLAHPLADETPEDDAEGWRHYLALVAQVNNSPEWGKLLMGKFFDPLAQRFVDALLRALPSSAAVDIYWCYHILSGALTLTFAQTGRIDHLSGGLCQSTDMVAAYERMVPFVTKGIEAVCGTRSP